MVATLSVACKHQPDEAQVVSSLVVEDAGGASVDEPTPQEVDRLIQQRQLQRDAETRPLEILRRVLQSSATVVRIEVTAAEGGIDPLTQSIVTSYKVSLSEVVKTVTGYTPRVDSILLAGGEKDGMVSQAPHAPRLYVGHQYLVLAQRETETEWLGLDSLQILEVVGDDLHCSLGTIARADFNSLLPSLGQGEAQ
jgi:hypothetical protein